MTLIGNLLWDNFDLILFGLLAMLALAELNSGFSMIEFARAAKGHAEKAALDGQPESAAPLVKPKRRWFGFGALNS